MFVSAQKRLCDNENLQPGITIDLFKIWQFQLISFESLFVTCLLFDPDCFWKLQSYLFTLNHISVWKRDPGLYKHPQSNHQRTNWTLTRSMSFEAGMLPENIHDWLLGNWSLFILCVPVYLHSSNSLACFRCFPPAHLAQINYQTCFDVCDKLMVIHLNQLYWIGKHVKHAGHGHLKSTAAWTPVWT